MPSQESLHEYYLHQHSNIENYLGLCLIHADAEVVHELRLSIKKLRAFHKLAEELCLAQMQDHIHIKKRIRRLFRLAGQLRDTQVQMHMLVDRQELSGLEYPEFSEWLLKREKKRITRFRKKPLQVIPHATAEAILLKIGDWLSLATDETILSGATRVLTGLYTKANKLSARKMNAGFLHHIRTLIKQIKYILNIMQHSYPDFVFDEISATAIHQIETSVGYWHDTLVRVELLGKFITKSDYDDDTLMLKYQKLLDECKAELDVAFNEAYHVVQSELH